MVSIPFGGSPYQLCIALLVGAVFSLNKPNSRSEAARWGGKSSLLIGGVIILFGWSHITLSLLSLASWVLSGWLAALVGYEIVSRVHSGLHGKYFEFPPPAKFVPRHMHAAAPERATTSQFPGFDGLRLAAAVAVLLCHAFVIADVGQAFWRNLFGFFGDYGVYTFFIISGFLLQRSLSLNLDPIQFTINRTLRLLPGFVFCILVMTFAFGPIVSPLNIKEYLFQSLIFDYVRESLTCLCDTWQMPFAFTTNPDLMYTKNAALWSLSYEVRCYLFLLLIWAVLRDKTVVVLLAVGGATVLLLVPSANEATFKLSYTLMPFIGGMLMYSFHERFGTNILMGAACAGAMVVAVFAHVQLYAFPIAGAYLLVLLAQYSNPLSRFAARWGDLSYGVYLFGWPIQMLLKPLTITGSGWELFAYSLPASMAVAGVSWWCVERPSLRAKGLFKNSAILLQHAIGASCSTAAKPVVEKLI